MKKNVFTFLMLALLAFIGNQVYAQITIGALRSPHASSVLEVVSPNNDKGVLIPEMSAVQRGLIDSPANGLLIYNTDENCFNYYDATKQEWISLCGGIANATGSVDCKSSLVNGTYVQGTPMNGGNYLTVPVTVTKGGMYTITASPNPANGYYFTASGSFPEAGNYTVNLTANGTPTNANPQGDPIILTLNGIPANCSGLSIPVSPMAPDYTITSITAMPSFYMIHTPLTHDNYYLTVTLNVKSPGTWRLASNKVNGYSFGAQGNISQASGFNPNGTYPQTVTVTVPVTAGMAEDKGTGVDNFVLNNSEAVTSSTYPFQVKLANVGFSVNCGTASVTGDGFVQNKYLTNQTIVLPVTVTSPGTTTITASGGGILFSSGEIDLDISTKTVTLLADKTVAPNSSGDINLTIGSSEGGLNSACNISVNVKAATANITSMTLSGITPSDGNYIIDAKGNTAPTVTLSVISATAGEYNISSTTMNGVTYQAAGTLMASSTSQIITLYPTGTPTKVAGTQEYTVTSGSQAVKFNINFVYRAMSILCIGSSNYNLSTIASFINTSDTEGKKNFGVNGTVPTAGITLTSSTRLSEGSLASFINSTTQYDIILTGYDNSNYNTADVTAAVNFVNNGGVLFLATENYSNANMSSSSNETVESIMAQLFKVKDINYNNNTSSLWYAANTNLELFQSTNTDDPILNGSFGDIRGKYLGGDYDNTSALLVGALPSSTAIALATPLSGATITPAGMGITPSNSWFAVRHSTKGFVWTGDGGFWGAYNSTGYARLSPVNNTSPLKTQNWTDVSSENGISGTQQVYNGIFLMNFLEYAIKYSGTYISQ